MDYSHNKCFNILVANSNVHISFRLVSVDWFFFSLWVICFCFIAWFFFFNEMPDIVDFTLWLLDIAAFLQIFLNLGLGHSWVTWKQFDPFRCCFYDLLVRPMLVLELIIPHSWGKTLPSTLSFQPAPSDFWNLAAGSMHYSSPGWVLGTVSSSPFQCFFPQSLVFSHMHELSSIQLNT